MLEADTAASSPPGQARGLPDRLRNWSGRMGGSLTAMVDNLTKGTFCCPDLHSHHALLCCAAMPWSGTCSLLSHPAARPGNLLCSNFCFAVLPMYFVFAVPPWSGLTQDRLGVLLSDLRIAALQVKGQAPAQAGLSVHVPCLPVQLPLPSP